MWLSLTLTTIKISTIFWIYWTRFYWFLVVFKQTTWPINSFLLTDDILESNFLYIFCENYFISFHSDIMWIYIYICLWFMRYRWFLLLHVNDFFDSWLSELKWAMDFKIIFRLIFNITLLEMYALISLKYIYVVYKIISNFLYICLIFNDWSSIPWSENIFFVLLHIFLQHF